ncbi:MAG: gamma-glutamyltransferase family protein [Acidobacteriia bacterium]|nr:gamma-glutamyltransferase family protein [Terriglobia bacterium]
MIKRIIAAALFLVASPLHAQTFRPEIRGSHGIVGSGRYYSVAAGIRMLELGGNAIDAGVATVFASSVVEVSHFGFGGEVPLMIYDARSKKVIVINGQGTAPRDLKPEFFRKMTDDEKKAAHFKNSAGVELPLADIGQGKIPGNGPLAATLPAVMDSLALALENYGTMSLEQVMQPAIELADGFPFVEGLEHYWEQNRKFCEKYPDTMTAYFPGGKTPEVGEMFRQSNLAKTFRALVAAERQEFRRSHDRRKAIEAGRDAFYKGDIARRIADADLKAGGVITFEDLAQYHGKLEQPTTTNYRGYQIYKAGFWDQGPVLLMTLNILEGFDLADMGLDSTEFIHTVTEAVKLAYDDRNAYFGDPDFVKVPAEGLLSKEYAATRRALINPRKAALDHRPGDPWKYEGVAGRRADASGSRYFADSDPGRQIYVPHAEGDPTVGFVSGDTTCVNAVDKDGNLFSASPSSGWILGGAFIAGDTGVPLSNRAQVFSLDEKSPNYLVGGKHPRTTLTPTLVLVPDSDALPGPDQPTAQIGKTNPNGPAGEPPSARKLKPYLALSTPGGDSQDQQVLNVLLNLIDFKMPIQQAIEAPRLNTDHPFSSFDNHQDKPGDLTLESRVAPGVIDALRAKGHLVTVLGPYGMYTGMTAVGVDPKFGTLFGGADVRRERYLMGW